MSTKTSDLTALTGANVDPSDLFYIVDTGTGSKKITAAELFAAFPAAVTTAMTGSGAAATDELLFSDAGTPKTITVPELMAAFFAAVTTTMAGSDVTEGTDEVMVSDGGVPKTMTFTELASAIVLATFSLGDIPEYADQAAAATALGAGKLFRFSTTGALGIALT